MELIVKSTDVHENVSVFLVCNISLKWLLYAGKRLGFERGLCRTVSLEIRQPAHSDKVTVFSTVEERNSFLLLSVICKCNLVPLNWITAASTKAVEHDGCRYSVRNQQSFTVSCFRIPISANLHSSAITPDLPNMVLVPVFYNNHYKIFWELHTDFCVQVLYFV